MPRGSGHPDLSQRPRREAPGMLTGFAILERELGAIDYERHRLEGVLAARPPKVEAQDLRARLRALQARRETALRLLDGLHAEDDERVQRGVEAVRARASRSPPTRRESRERARERLGLPPRQPPFS